MLSLNNWTLRRRILVLPCLFSIGFVFLLLANVILEKKMFREVIFPNYDSQILTGHKRTLKTLVDSEAAALGERVRQLNTREEKIAAIIADTDAIRFFDDSSGYFFTYLLDGVRINVPVNKAENGKNHITLQDANGVKFIEGLINKAKAGGGFIEYNFEKVGKGVQPKISYAKMIPGTDILVGTGVYVDDVQAERMKLEALIKQSASRFMLYRLAAFAVLLAMVVVASVLTAQAISRFISRIIVKLFEGSSEVTAASHQVSSVGQAMAEGASEQAASLEESSASLEEMSSMTKRNADNAQKANELAKQAREAADKGAADMQGMSAAMQAIKVSSDDIAKIIKTIDEIAFQTNILALNAAVEAARAGESGMGFAVVADEVRNLAQRSAQAARETASKIEGAIVKTTQGVDLSGKVSQALNDIVIKTRQVDELAAEVASASREQTSGIAQINVAVGQMDKVTQSNAASAEETAAAAEELNAQALAMTESVNELLQLVGGQANDPAKPANPLQTKRTAAAPPTARRRFAGTDHREPIPMDADFKDS